MASRSLLKRSSKSEIIRLAIWKAFGQAGMRLFRKRPLKETPNLDATCAVFLCGLHRSGTSVLHRILRQNRQVDSFTNTGVPEDEGQHLQTVFPAARNLGGPGLFAFASKAHMTEKDAYEIGSKRDVLFREWGAYINFSHPYFIEKSPPNLVRARFFQGTFPKTKFIIIVRHPIAVAMATAEKWGIDLEKSLNHWIHAHEIYLKDSQLLVEKTLVSYEKMCSHPQETLAAISEFLDLEVTLGEETLKNVNREYFDKWRDLVPATKTRLGEKMNEASKTLKSLGYGDWDDFEHHSGQT